MSHKRNSDSVDTDQVTQNAASDQGQQSFDWIQEVKIINQTPLNGQGTGHGILLIYFRRTWACNACRCMMQLFLSWTIIYPIMIPFCRVWLILGESLGRRFNMTVILLTRQSINPINQSDSINQSVTTSFLPLPPLLHNLNNNTENCFIFLSKYQWQN